MTSPLRGRPAAVQKDRIVLADKVGIDLKLLGDGDQIQVIVPGQWSITQASPTELLLTATVAAKKGRLPKDGTELEAEILIGKEAFQAKLTSWSTVSLTVPRGWVLSSFARSVVSDSGRTKLMFVSAKTKKAAADKAEAKVVELPAKRTRARKTA